MATLSHRLNVFSDGHIEAVKPAPLFWVPHDLFRFSYDNPKDRRFNPEGDGKVRATTIGPIPEVYNVFVPGTDLKLPPEFQALVPGINPDLTCEKAMTLLGLGLAFCNHQFGTLDPPRLMGGAVVTGTVSGSNLLLKTIRTDRPCPKAADVLADPTLWFWCVSVNAKGIVTLWQRRGADGNMYPCRFPLFGNGLSVPLNEFMPIDHVPDPRWMPA